MLSTVVQHPIIILPARIKNSALLWVVLLLTGLNGIAIDLYTPSLPAIATALHVSATVAKASISVGLIGFAVGVLFLGSLSDRWGRRSMILFGLLVFVIASIMGASATNIYVFMVSRLLQGAGVATAAMLARAMLLDHFTGKKLYTAMLYTTTAWGLGPVIAPYIGGYLQTSFGWHANFVLYAAYSLALFILALFFMPETLALHKRTRATLLSRFQRVFSNRQFVLFALLSAFCFIQFVLYSTVGAFIVEGQLGLSAITFGHTALLVGFGYFIGTMIGRLLLKTMTLPRVLCLGMGIILLANMSLFLMNHLYYMSLWPLVIPIMLVTLGVGIIFPIAIASALEPLRQHAGVAASMHGFVVMFLGFLLTGLISQFHIVSIGGIAWLVLAIWVAKAIFMWLGVRDMAKKNLA
jgi:Bcr/CflA subfamily drug resistance transporter